MPLDVKCTWCDRKWEWYAVFGHYKTLEVWDVRLCNYHRDLVMSNKKTGDLTDAIFAPLNSSSSSFDGRYATDWELKHV